MWSGVLTLGVLPGNRGQVYPFPNCAWTRGWSQVFGFLRLSPHIKKCQMILKQNGCLLLIIKLEARLIKGENEDRAEEITWSCYQAKFYYTKIHQGRDSTFSILQAINEQEFIKHLQDTPHDAGFWEIWESEASFLHWKSLWSCSSDDHVTVRQTIQ